MNLEKYVDEIARLIESNLNKLRSRNILKNAVYRMYSKNFFELSLGEYKKFSNIVDEIANENDLSAKFPKKYIFEKNMQ